MTKMNMIFAIILFVLWSSCAINNDTTPDDINVNTVVPKETKSEVSFLALGDSYTIGQNVEENERFPMQLAKRLYESDLDTGNPTIIARTGWTTDELAKGIEDANLKGPYDFVTLLIGVNNQYRGRDTAEYRQQFRELLNKAIGFTNGIEKKVIVISIPDYGVTPFGISDAKRIGAEIDIFNGINKEETILRKANYVYITSISREAKYDRTLIASDGLHPSGKMYSLWVDAIFPVAKNMLNNR